MADYRYSQPNPNHPSQSHHVQYDAYGEYSEDVLRRNASFDAGDDGAYGPNGQSAGSGTRGYEQYPAPSSRGSQRGLASAHIQTALPTRTGSGASPLSHYQYQYQPAPPTPSHGSYNPAHFAQTQSQSQPQYNPQSYGSPQTTYGAYQPYVPAYVPSAYSQESNLQRQSSVYSPGPVSPQATYHSVSPAPPPPPRPSESPYGQQSMYGSYQGQQTQQSNYSPVMTSAASQARQQAYTSSVPTPPAHSFYDPAPQPYSHSAGYTQQHSHSHHEPPTYTTYEYRNSASLTRTNTQSSSFVASPQPSLPSPPSRGELQLSPRRTESLRHPQGAQLPVVPSESDSDNDYFVPHSQYSGQSTQVPMESDIDNLMKEMNDAIDQGHRSNAPSISSHRRSVSGRNNLSFSSQPLVSPDEAPTHINGNVVTSGDTAINYGAFSDDSDAEAAAGLAAMQAAEEQEAAEEARRRSGSASLFSTHGSHRQVQRKSSSQDISSDSEYNVDMSLMGGGYEGHMQYGDRPMSNYAAAAAAMPQSDYYNRLNARMDSVRSTGVSSEGMDSQTSGYESIPAQDEIHPFPPFRTDVARVDTGGTGGLTEPSPHPRRLSFEDGDEATLADPDAPHALGISPTRESLPDMFFHPGMSPHRPLPPPPSNSDPGHRLPHLIPAGTYGSINRSSQYDPRPYPAAPDAYAQSALLSPSTVPRSTSLNSARSAPKPEQPIRSKTDADRAKILKQAQMAGRPMSDVYEGSAPPSAVALDLPTLPRKKFNPAKLSTDQFKKCSEPWAMTSIIAWIQDLAEEETDLKEHAVNEAIVALFTHKVPTMNTTDAETLGSKVVEEMFKAGALIKEEEWVKFGSGMVTSVIFQLSGSGCYSPKLHNYPVKGRCYSHHCMRTLKKVDLSLAVDAEKKREDWHTFYKLKKEDWENQPKKEIERQNVLHEIVTSEDIYIGHLDVLRILYRDQLRAAEPPIIPAKRLSTFIKEVFGKVDQVKKVNEDYLLAQLKYRQNEQGPWIVGFSDIFREWIRRAKSIYVEYAAAFSRADYLIRQEMKRNLLFQQFLDQARDDKRSNKLSWDTYLKDPIVRLQRYSLLLQTVHKNMPKESEEKTNLQQAIEEVRTVTFECNNKVAEEEKKTALIDLASNIKLRKGMEKEVELNLDHLGREILLQGPLQRAGGKGFQWVDTHAILFDHYLVLAKPVISRDSSGSRKQDYYDVSKVPIPMDLIVLESTNDNPVVKSKVAGVSAVPLPQVTSRVPGDPWVSRNTPTITGGPGTLTHTNTNTSVGSTDRQSMITTTVLGDKDDQKIMYPFRVKHLGKPDTYTLYAPSEQKREEWCDKITLAKKRHAASLYAQNAEPFRLRVLADAAFGYETLATSTRPVVIPGTPLDRAVQEAEAKYAGQGRPAPVCRAAVNCATVFQQPFGVFRCAVGTDYGVYISEYGEARGWIRSISMPRVTQVAVFEEFNLFLLISEKALIAYHLDVVCPPHGNHVPQNTDTSSRKAPQKLSGTKDVGFFAAGKMKDRALVFYKKRDGMSSTFKVLEPVLQKSTVTRSRFLPSSTRRGQTEFFREYDEFYIPAECYSMNLFHSSLAISTARGVEVLTLDKKLPWSVPNLRNENPETQAHLSSIASRIKDLRPLGMFRLGEAEFLVAFEECAVYVNKHGDVSRSVVMEFVGRAKAACLYGQYLILFDDDFVEIRNAMNGRMKQVIAARDVKLLDDGGGGNGSASTPQMGTTLGGGLNGLGLQGIGVSPRTVKICMQHPEYEKSHVIVELVENEDQQE